MVNGLRWCFRPFNTKNQCFYDTLFRIVMVSTVQIFSSSFFSVGNVAFLSFFLLFFLGFFSTTHQINMLTCEKNGSRKMMSDMSIYLEIHIRVSMTGDGRMAFRVAWKSKKINTLVKYLLIHSVCIYVYILCYSC